MTEQHDEEAPAAPELHCQDAQCQFAVDGACRLGKEPIDCENIELQPVDDDQAAPPASPTVSLWHGYSLSPNELSVLARRRSSVVVALGDAYSGRTTLLATLFEHLTSGRFAGWQFVGSRTTLGFAERLHRTSLRSGMSQEATDHTPIEESGRYLHIDARSDAQISTLLFVEVPGEHVAKMTRGSVPPTVAMAIDRATQILLVVDGALAGEPETREAAFRTPTDLVHLLKARDLGSKAGLAIVLTKVDQITPTELVAVLARCDSLVNGETITFEVAARPAKGSPLAPAHGLLELLTHVAALPDRTAIPMWAIPEISVSRSIRRLWKARP